MRFRAKFNEYDRPNKGGMRHKQVIPVGANANDIRIESIELMQEWHDLYQKNTQWHHTEKLPKQNYDPAWTQHKNLAEAKNNNDKRKTTVQTHYAWEADILRNNVVVDDVVSTNLQRLQLDDWNNSEERDLYCEIYDRYYQEIVDIHGPKTNYLDLIVK
tara:strand:+ start:409 stop:885 length:477 start_codon:yes stop_codon:yes gene_type:complete